MDWKRLYILIVNLAYRAGHSYTGILNTLFHSFCEFPGACVRIQSIVSKYWVKLEHDYYFCAEFQKYGVYTTCIKKVSAYLEF